MDGKKYDIAVSYASEQRPYVERFVKRLQSHKLSVYYDRDAQTKMVGKILDQALHKIYIQQSKHCVLFLSEAYVEKPVTRYESQIILSETLFKDHFMYIFKFDNVALPGLNRNFIYSNIQEFLEPEQYADFMYEVIQGEKPKNSTNISLYKTLSDEIEEMLKRYAERWEFTLQTDRQPNKLLLRLQSGKSNLLQIQVGQLPGKSGVCFWIHRGCHSCDEHAYQGYVQWSAKNCCYILENRGMLLDLMPEIAFSSMGSLIKRLDTDIQTMLGG